MNYSINSFTGASEAPAYGGYVLVICKKNNVCADWNYYSSDETYKRPRDLRLSDGFT